MKALRSPLLFGTLVALLTIVLLDIGSARARRETAARAAFEKTRQERKAEGDEAPSCISARKLRELLDLDAGPGSLLVLNGESAYDPPTGTIFRVATVEEDAFGATATLRINDESTLRVHAGMRITVEAGQEAHHFKAIAVTSAGVLLLRGATVLRELDAGVDGAG